MSIYQYQEDEEKWVLPISTACTLSAAHTLTLTGDVLGKLYSTERAMLSHSANRILGGIISGGSITSKTLGTAIRLRSQKKLKAINRTKMTVSKEEPHLVKSVYTLHGAQFALEQMRAPALYREEASFCRTDIGEWSTLSKRKAVKVYRYLSIQKNNNFQSYVTNIRFVNFVSIKMSPFIIDRNLSGNITIWSKEKPVLGRGLICSFI